jgi:hypothetical protein
MSGNKWCPVVVESARHLCRVDGLAVCGCRPDGSEHIAGAWADVTCTKCLDLMGGVLSWVRSIEGAEEEP